jgi:hypothetical protein
MTLTRDAVHARLTTFLSGEVRQALEPLVRRENYALDLQLVLNPPAADEEARLSSLGENPRDSDLLSFIQQVKIKLTLDERVKKPAAGIIRDTVSAAADPLRGRTGDDIQIAYADLSSLKAALAVSQRRKKAVAPRKDTPAPQKAAEPVVAPPVVQTPVVAPQVTVPPVAVAELSFNSVYPAMALVLAAAILALAVFGAATRVSRKLETAFGPLADALSQLLRLPEIVAQGLETLRSLLAEHRQAEATVLAAQANAQASAVEAAAQAVAQAAMRAPAPPQPVAFPAAVNGAPIPIAIVSGGMPPLAAVPSEPKQTAEPGAGRARVRPISSYSLEKQLNSKRKILFQNPAAVARVLLTRFPATGGKDESLLASFLKSLAPKETEALSRHLSADELLRFSRLASAGGERASVNALISFVEEIGPEVATQAGLSVPIARAVELLEKFDPEHLSATVRECPLEVAGIILRSIPPETREEVFARFEGQAREDLLRHIAQPAPADPATKIPAIAESAVRVCLRAGLKDLLLLWLSEARSLLPRERYEALLNSIQEEASGLIADPRRTPLK